VLLATHDLPAAAAVCRRAVVLSAGSVAYDGAIDQLLSDRELLGELGLEAAL